VANIIFRVSNTAWNYESIF